MPKHTKKEREKNKFKSNLGGNIVVDRSDDPARAKGQEEQEQRLSLNERRRLRDQRARVETGRLEAEERAKQGGTATPGTQPNIRTTVQGDTFDVNLPLNPADFSSPQSFEQAKRIKTGGGRGGLSVGGETTQQEQTRETGEAVAGVEQRFQEGQFEEPTQQPIIDPVLTGNLGVIKDIGKDVLGLIGIKKGVTGTRGAFGIVQRGETAKGAIDLNIEPKTQAEFQMQTKIIMDATQQGITTVIDDAITEADNIAIRSVGPVKQKPVKLKQLGIGVGTGVITGGGAVVLGGTIFDALRQRIGSDKTVKNLEAAIINYDQIPLDILTSVDNGLPIDHAFRQIDRIEDSINEIERALKQAAITSPNVRVSLRGVEVESKIFKVRGEIFKTRNTLAAKQLGIAFGEEQLPSSIAFLNSLHNKYNP